MRYCPSCGDYVGGFSDDAPFPNILCTTPQFHGSIMLATEGNSPEFNAVPIRILASYWWDPGIEGQFANLTDWLAIHYIACGLCYADKGNPCC